MADQYCVNVTMAYGNGQGGVLIEENEVCGDGNKVGGEAVEWRDEGLKAGHVLLAMDRYFKDENGNRQMLDKPAAWCGWLAFEGNCWNRSSVVERPKVVQDEVSYCYERAVAGFFESSKEWVCLPK